MIGKKEMKELIKKIRELAQMNQEQFAKAIGTTPVSINRWENGKTVPNRMAQKQIYEFCLVNNIDIAYEIVQSFESTDNGNRLIVYHGSRNGIEGDIAPVSHEECDFGKAFYMGTNTLQPLTLVCMEKSPKFYAIEPNLDGLKTIKIGIDMDWAMIIAYYRKQMESAKGTAIYEKYAHYLDGYDLVVGYIANDRMYTELTNFFEGNITDVALLKCLSALDLGMQYVALTPKACKQMKILFERTIEPLELSILQDMSVKRRKEGVELADNIVRQYRREGKYFDEILGGK